MEDNRWTIRHVPRKTRKKVKAYALAKEMSIGEVIVMMAQKLGK